MEYALAKRQWNATIYGSVNNCWDEQYFVLEQRPIPGRTYQLGIKFKLYK